MVGTNRKIVGSVTGLWVIKQHRLICRGCRALSDMGRLSWLVVR